jgi:hypothetical protein
VNAAGAGKLASVFWRIYEIFYNNFVGISGIFDIK